MTKNVKKISKQIITLVLAFIMMLSSTQFIPMTAEAATNSSYTSFNNFIGTNHGGDSSIIPAKWVRFDLPWDALQPVKGQTNQTVLNSWKSQIQAYINQGITVLPVLSYNAPWATATGNVKDPIKTANIPDWQNYVDLVVSTFSAAPYNMTYFQVWNEAHPNSGFYNDTLDNFIANIHKPAADVIHRHGCKVVYGGFPSCGTTDQYISLLDRTNAWSTIDVFDLHYYNLYDWDLLYTAASSRGITDANIWQTEVGFTTDLSYIPNNFSRFYYWAANRFMKPDQFKLFYFEWWAPDAPDAHGYHECLNDSNGLYYHGRELKNLTNLMAGSNVVPYTGFSNDQGISFDIDKSKSSIEGYKIGSDKAVIAVHYKGAASNVKLTFSNVIVNSATAAKRVDILGNQTNLSFADDGNGKMSVSVPVSDPNSEARSINSGEMKTFYVTVPLLNEGVPLVNNGIYKIESLCAPGKVLDVANNYPGNGGNVHIWSSAAGVTSQKWKAVNAGGGYWQFVPQHSASRVLDIAGGGSADGTNVQIADNIGSNAQKWKVTADSNGNLTLEAACAPYKVLDVASSGTIDGTNVQIYTSNGSNAQKWKFSLQSDALVNNGIYRIDAACALGKSLDVANNDTANGGNVHIWANVSGVNSQKWKAVDLGGGYWKFIPQHAASKAMDVASSGTADGTNVQIYDDNSSSAQKWKASYDENGYLMLESACAPGKVLEVSGGANANGANVQIWTNTGNIAKKWILIWQ